MPRFIFFPKANNDQFFHTNVFLLNSTDTTLICKHQQPLCNPLSIIMLNIINKRRVNGKITNKSEQIYITK